MTFSSVVTAGTDACCKRAMDCRTVVIRASRSARSNSGSFCKRCRVLGEIPNDADKKEPAWISDPRPAHLEGIQDWLSVTAMAAASAETVASAKAVATEARVSAKTTAGCEAPRDAAAEARRSGAHGHHAWGHRHHA